MTSYRPSFAQNQLHKHGWEEGKGLGKSENGIKSAIKVKVKNNKVGLGHDAGAEFTFHWWDHIFNKAANAIEVIDDESKEEVVLRKNEKAKNIVPQLMYNKKPLGKSANGKPLLYGTFVSGGMISADNCDSKGSTPQASSESDSESEEEEEYSTDLLDRTFKKTGLTGHKGARHGHRLSGKLKRIQEQESSATNVEKSKCEKTKKSITTGQTDDPEQNVKKKIRKRKVVETREKYDCDTEENPRRKKKKKKNTDTQESLDKKSKKKKKKNVQQ